MLTPALLTAQVAKGALVATGALNHVNRPTQDKFQALQLVLKVQLLHPSEQKLLLVMECRNLCGLTRATSISAAMASFFSICAN